VIAPGLSTLRGFDRYLSRQQTSRFILEEGETGESPLVACTAYWRGVSLWIPWRWNHRTNVSKPSPMRHISAQAGKASTPARGIIFPGGHPLGAPFTNRLMLLSGTISRPLKEDYLRK